MRRAGRLATTRGRLLVLLLLTLGPKLLKKSAPLVGRHLVNLGGSFGTQALQNAAYALLRFGWELIDPRGRARPGGRGW